MPTILHINGFRFFFYSNEHEPIHIHVQKGEANAKLILLPNVDWVYSYEFTNKEQKEILSITEIQKIYFINEWKKYFKDGNNQ